MSFRFHNLLGAPYRGGNAVISNNTLLLSPIGNRVSLTDLVKSDTTTLPDQSSSNISRIAVSPNGTFLLTVDDQNHCLFINLHRRSLLHRFSFKKRVAAVKFSPDGSLIAVAAGKLLQIWRFKILPPMPFEKVQSFADFNADITCLDWSPKSTYLIVGSKDLTARILCLKKLRDGVKYRPFLFLGHRDSVIAAFFGVDSKTKRIYKAYTVTRDCYLFSWGFSVDDEDRDLMIVGNCDVKKRKEREIDEGYLSRGKWELLRKDGFMQEKAKASACDYHRGLDMMVVGFSNGMFGLYKMPEFVCIHMLSISREKITTVVFNELGNWCLWMCQTKPAPCVGVAFGELYIEAAGSLL